ncbi:MAG: hypothetical protein IKA97_02225 [Clostridia bacterium]|nr:hypothetical protein [Clostridia bacterium]MBR2397568.1 hypothetical protein [Clostridia bacterium]
MKTVDVIEKMGLTPVVMADGNREIKSAYCGDFLSFSISKQGEACIWFTVMNNVNVAGVASLTDCALIVLCEGVLPDEALTIRAKMVGINIAKTEKSAYQAAIDYYKISES